jgi:hypothetical protein
MYHLNRCNECTGGNIKSCPATRHADAETERSYRSYSFLTLELDDGKWSAPTPVPTGKKAGWASDQV